MSDEFNNINSKIKIPAEAEEIIDILYKNNFEAYLVGGCVRDYLLNKIPKDWDITTDARPEEIKNIFSGFARVVDTGIAHGTVSVILNKNIFEVTTYRIDGDYKDYRRPEKVFFASNLKEDLSRRDFSMNSIAYNKKNGFIDIFNGLHDINKKIIKCVGDPEKRFNEDALRMIRAIRFACQLDFNIDPETYYILKKNIELIRFISIERVRDELIKLFMSRNADKFFLLADSNILEYINHDFNNYFKHNFLGIKKNILKLNLFLARDFDKLYKNNYESEFLAPEKKIFYYGYKKSEIVYYMIITLVLYKIKFNSASALLKFFRFDNKTCDIIKALLFFLYKKISADSYVIKKFVLKLGIDNFFVLIYLKKIMGQKNIYKINALAKKILYNHECVFIKDLLISGNDIKKLGFTGKQIGSVLNYLLNIIHSDHEKNDYKKLISLAIKLKKCL